ncbi:MAG TPA: succinate dehydrogenase, hydrophobic membrane anchor protein [Gammaproteobacteria bacterium]|nr:succinate dehydrogenase, hydrophobic membrane anchor protein [Gammaproteobacteria bacterium]
MSSRKGFRDWLIQRITAVFLGVYSVIFLLFFLRNPHPTYIDWSNFFYQPIMQICTFIMLISLMWHAWIGLWTIITDYIKPISLRLITLGFVILILFYYFAWIFKILWG